MEPLTGAKVARVSVVIPALNEEQSIGEVIRGVAAAGGHRIIVADGGSTDRTVAEAKVAGAEVIMAGKGYGRACWMATQAAGAAEVMVIGQQTPGSACAIRNSRPVCRTWPAATPLQAAEAMPASIPSAINR